MTALTVSALLSLGPAVAKAENPRRAFAVAVGARLLVSSRPGSA